MTEVQRTLGPKSEKNPEADQQSFLRPVLLFTLHAMLNALHQQQQQSASTELAALDASQEATSVDDTQFVQKFEAAVPLLLPLIAEVSAACISTEQEAQMRVLWVHTIAPSVQSAGAGAPVEFWGGNVCSCS